MIKTSDKYKQKMLNNKNNNEIKMNNNSIKFIDAISKVKKVVPYKKMAIHIPSNIENEINNIELVKDDFMKKSEDNITDEIENIELVKDDFLNRSEINLETIYKNDIGLSISIGG